MFIDFPTFSHCVKVQLGVWDAREIASQEALKDEHNRGAVPGRMCLKIMRHFDTRKDGQVSYNEFCDALLPGENSGGDQFLEIMS